MFSTRSSASARPTAHTAVLIAAIILTIAVHALYISNKSIGLGQAYALDDALITFRYSQNLAHGRGFVYNSNERVLGTTTPLYALLGSIPAYLGVDLVWYAAILNTVLDVVVVALLVHVFRGFFIAQVVGPLLFSLHPYVLYYASAGMEMSLLSLLVLATFSLFWEKHYSLAGVTAALAVMCRIDGILAVGALGLVAILVQRKLPIRFMVVFALSFSGWVLFAVTYFGNVVPQSALAKQIWRSGAHPLTVWVMPSAAILVIMAILGAAVVILNPLQLANTRTRCWLLSIVAWWAMFSAFFMISRVEIEDWYRVPQCLMVAVLAAWCAEVLLRYFKKTIDQRYSILTAGMIGILLMTGAFTFREMITTFQDVIGLFQRGAPEPVFEIYRQTALWLEENAQPGVTVLAGNIGFIGYYCNCRILDDVGLVSPEILPYVIKNKLNRSILITTFRPEFLAIEQREYVEMEQVLQSEGYELKAEFASKTPFAMSPYRIYARTR